MSVPIKRAAMPFTAQAKRKTSVFPSAEPIFSVSSAHVNNRRIAFPDAKRPESTESVAAENYASIISALEEQAPT